MISIKRQQEITGIMVGQALIRWAALESGFEEIPTELHGWYPVKPKRLAEADSRVAVMLVMRLTR